MQFWQYFHMLLLNLRCNFIEYRKRLDEGFVLRYLRVAKFDVKNAVNRLERFFQLQRDWPELYGHWKFDERMERLLEAGSTELMPDPDEDGVRYLVFRLSAWDPAVDSVHEVYRACIFLWEYILLELVPFVNPINNYNLTISESIQVNGVKVCGDQGSLSWNHLKNTPMKVNKLWAQAVDGCYPIRNKKVAMIKVSGTSIGSLIGLLLGSARRIFDKC